MSQYPLVRSVLNQLLGKAPLPDMEYHIRILGYGIGLARFKAAVTPLVGEITMDQIIAGLETHVRLLQKRILKMYDLTARELSFGSDPASDAIAEITRQELAHLVQQQAQHQLLYMPALQIYEKVIHDATVQLLTSGGRTAAATAGSPAYAPAAPDM